MVFSQKSIIAAYGKLKPGEYLDVSNLTSKKITGVKVTGNRLLADNGASGFSHLRIVSLNDDAYKLAVEYLSKTESLKTESLKTESSKTSTLTATNNRVSTILPPVNFKPVELPPIKHLTNVVLSR